MKELDDMLYASDDVIDAARKVEFIVMDVDGVLTDGRVYQLDNGEQFQCFWARDGTAINLCKFAGIGLAVISGRNVDAARIRMGRFDIPEMHFGCMNKVPVLESISSRLDVPFERMAYIGDDLIDVPPMKMVGLPVAVPDAAPETLEAALYRTAKPGGEGAVRELIVLVLKARGLYEKAVRLYLEG